MHLVVPETFQVNDVSARYPQWLAAAGGLEAMLSRVPMSNSMTMAL